MVMTVAKDAVSGERWLEGDQEYCAIITLDVKNAFNSADWDAALVDLNGNDVQNYLMNYCKDIILYDTDDGSYSHAVSVGIPKGSVLGPILWNVMYDGVLRLKTAQRYTCHWFCGRYCPGIRGEHLDELVRKRNIAVDMDSTWNTEIDIKTNVLLVSSSKRMEFITITVGDQPTTSNVLGRHVHWPE